MHDLNAFYATVYHIANISANMRCFSGHFPENFVIVLFSAHNFCFCLKIAITIMIVGSKHDFKGRGDIRVSTLNETWSNALSWRGLNYAIQNCWTYYFIHCFSYLLFQSAWIWNKISLRFVLRQDTFVKWLTRSESKRIIGKIL